MKQNKKKHALIKWLFINLMTEKSETSETSPGITSENLNQLLLFFHCSGSHIAAQRKIYYLSRSCMRQSHMFSSSSEFVGSH